MAELRGAVCSFNAVVTDFFGRHGSWQPPKRSFVFVTTKRHDTRAQVKSNYHFKILSEIKQPPLLLEYLIKIRLLFSSGLNAFHERRKYTPIETFFKLK